jgi:hypothetical protein
VMANEPSGPCYENSDRLFRHVRAAFLFRGTEPREEPATKS